MEDKGAATRPSRVKSPGAGKLSRVRSRKAKARPTDDLARRSFPLARNRRIEEFVDRPLETRFSLRGTPEGFALLTVDAEFEASTGLSGAAVTGRILGEVLSAELAGEISARCLRCVADGKEARFVQAMDLPAGRSDWEIALTPVPGETAAVTIILGRSRRLDDAGRPFAFAKGAKRPKAHPSGGSPPKGNLTFTVGWNWRIAGISPECAAWWGRDAFDLIGVDARGELLFPSPSFIAIQSALTTGEPARAEFRSLMHPGLFMEMEARRTDCGVFVHFWDMTYQELTRRGQQLSADPTSSLPSDERAETALLGTDGVIVTVNSSWRDALAALDLEPYGLGEHYVDVCGRIIPDLDAAALRQAVSDVAAGETEAFTHAYAVATPQGLAWRQVRISRIGVAGATYLIAIHEDLEDLARARAAVNKSIDGRLAVRKAREQERELIAAELHDSTGQHMAALGLGLAQLRRLVGEQEPVRDVINGMSASLNEAFKEMRLLSYLMRAPHLRRDGLDTTVRRLADGYATRSGLRLACTLEGDLNSASMAAQHTAFRIIQEALSNAHRHAKASTVEIALKCDPNILTVRVADDGKGIEELRHGGPDQTWGDGVSGMRARVEDLGGWFSISCEAVGGTVVSAWIPTI